MRRKTELEKSARLGEVRLQIETARSTLAPQWWEFRRLWRWWRLNQYVRSNRKKLAEETQIALAWAEEALEREFLFGKEK